MSRSSAGYLLCALFAASALSGLACSGATEPTRIAGAYPLSQIDGHAPPALLLATVNCDVWLNGALVELTPPSADASFTIRTDCSRVGGSVSDTALLYNGSVQLTGGAVSIALIDDPADTIRFTGSVSGQNLLLQDFGPGIAGGLTSHQALFGPRQDLPTLQ